MADRPKRRRAKRSASKRQAKAAQDAVIRRLPDSAVDPDKPVGACRGLERGARDAEDAAKVILTRDTIRLAVRRLARLAATWEATDEFATATSDMRDHSIRALTNVVSLLDLYTREMPIEHIDGFRITPEDANLLIVHRMVAAALDDYESGEPEEATLHRLAWTLGNAYRIPRDVIETAWRRFSSSSQKNWVVEHEGAVEAAKVFLASVKSDAGGRRVASLRKLTRTIAPGSRFSSDVEALFERMKAKAIGTPANPIDLSEYVRTVIGA